MEVHKTTYQLTHAKIKYEFEQASRSVNSQAIKRAEEYVKSHYHQNVLYGNLHD